MPDFRMQQNFPISAVIEAEQRKAQMENQTALQNSQLLNQSLEKIGEISQSLYDRKKRVAQSLALGKQFDIPDEVSRTMDPEQILKVGAIKKGQVDMNLLLNLLHPGTGGTTPQVGTPAGAPAAAPPATPATLASNVTTTPMEQPGINPGGLPPPTTGAMPVPIQAPPSKPQTVNPATFNAAFKVAQATRQDPVISQADALNRGSVPHGTHIVAPKQDQNILDPKYQNRLEKQYQDMKMKALSNRSGGLGLQDSKVNQAIDLRKLVNKYYDPKTGSFNVPPSQHAELALGLARLISPTGQVGIELMHELRQATGREALAKVLIYAGADPAQVGGPTQSVVKMFIDSIDRQGETAEQLRDQYQQYIRDNAPVDLEPTRKARHDQAKLNSFQDFLGKSPDRQTAQGGNWDASKEQRYQELLAKRHKGSVKL